MATTDRLQSNKRKRDPSLAAKGGRIEKPYPKKQQKRLDDPPKPQKSSKPYLPNKSSVVDRKKEPQTQRERRLLAKEKVESRKKRKPNYNLEKELASLWEKMRRYNIDKEERSKLVSEALLKMSGKFLEIASSHVSTRVLQTCIKYCSQAERDLVFEALRPDLLNLSRKKYAVHIVMKVLDNATKKELEGFISSLHGHVASLLRHTVGSAVVEHAFHLANGSQRQSLLAEMYSTELQLFKDLTLTNTGRLIDIISKLGLQKASVVQHMNSVIQPLLEKGIVDCSIIHFALVEYFTIADKTSAADVIEQLAPLLVQETFAVDDDDQLSAEHFSRKRKNRRSKLRIPLLVRMMRTRDGLKLGILCLKHGSAKDRKKIIKGIKEHIRKLAFDQCGSLLLVCILSVVDDTKLVTKVVIQELQKMLKELILDRNGRRLLLQLLHPLCPRYFSPDDLACLNLSIPSLCGQSKGSDASTEAGADKHSDGVLEVRHVEVGGKKDPSLRRSELLVESNLAEGLIETCIENIGELLRSNFGREVIYEVAVGGNNGILQPLTNRLDALHMSLASLAATPKTNESEEDHVLENFHSSRTIRKLVLDSPAFAVTLWEAAFAGKCEMWAQGYSSKVAAAFLESSDPNVRKLAKTELQPLIDRGILKVPEKKQASEEAA